MSAAPHPDVRGFLPDAEGRHLYALACEAARTGPLLEIGSYCGRSTIWLARAARVADTVVFAVDHHRGSEEHQPGELFHDPVLTDAEGCFDSLPEFRRNLARDGVEDAVIPIISDAGSLARYWQGSALGMVFIDGGHSLEAALGDYRAWAPRIAPGGILAIHDVFPHPGQGGMAPYTIWQLAADSGLFAPLAQHGSLRALRRLG